MGGNTIKLSSLARQFSVLLLAVFCLYMAHSSFNYRSYLEDASNRELSEWNLYKTEQRVSQDTNEFQIRSLKSQLEYMVWPEAQNKLLHRLKLALRQQINLSPYVGNSWFALHELEVRLGESEADQAFSLHQALRFDGWRVNQRYLHAYYCLYQRENLLPYAEQVCLSVLSRLPWEKGVEQLAQIIGVDKSLLEEVRLSIGDRP